MSETAPDNPGCANSRNNHVAFAASQQFYCPGKRIVHLPGELLYGTGFELQDSFS
jgi:hypothetical protein